MRNLLAAACLAVLLLSACSNDPDRAAAAEAAELTLAELATQPQPRLAPIASFPAVEALTGGGMTRRTAWGEVRLVAVAVGADGIAIRVIARADRLDRPAAMLDLPGQGSIRDELGNLYLPRPGKPQPVQIGSDSEVRFTLRFTGYPSPLARRYDLTQSFELVGAAGTSKPQRFRFDAPVVAASVAPEPHGWRPAAGASATSVNGGLSLRVRGLDVVKDGIALTFDANNSGPATVSLNADWSTALVDDRGTVLPIVHSDVPEARSLPVESGRLLSGRILFSGHPARDATRLYLSINAARPGEPVDPVADRASAPKLLIEIGTIPSAVPRSAAPRKLTIPQAAPPSRPLVASRTDILKRRLGAERVRGGTLVPLPSDKLFAGNGATVKAEAGPTLAMLTELISGTSGTIRIEGHTDAIDNPDENLSLSRRRAQAVADALAQRSLDRARLRVSGFGATRPRVPETSTSGQDLPGNRASNSRVDVILPEIR